MGVFDGIAGTLTGVFGAPVTFTPAGAASFTALAMFREDPITVTTEDGSEALVTLPTVRLKKPEADLVARDDIVDPGLGITYRIIGAHKSGSPADDAFMIFELEAT